MVLIFSTLVFVSELILWFGLGRLVYLQLSDRQYLAYLLAILACTLFILLWSQLFSPKASYRLARLPRTLMITLISLLLGFGLYKKGDLSLGLVLMLGVSLIQILGQTLLMED